MTKHTLKKHVGYWVNRLRMQIHQAFEKRLSRYDITMAQWCALIALYEERAHSINELASYIEVDKASISRVVERLRIKGLIQHLEGKDRRSSFLKLTSKGHDIVPYLIQEAAENEHVFFGDLPETELTQFAHLLQKILLHNYTHNLNERVKKADISVFIFQLSKTLDHLEQAGYISYRFYVSNYEGIYEGPSGQMKEKSPEGFQHLVIKSEFSLLLLIKALRRHEKSDLTYLDLLAEMAAAGVSYYHINVGNRTITYFDQDDHPLHQEFIPKVLG